jgi:type IV pilus assembly protein PilM
MALLKGLGDFFALDIGTTAVRVVQLAPAGNGGWSLMHYGYANLDEKLTSYDSNEGLTRLGDIIMTAVGQSGIKTKNVVIGIPSNRTFITVVDVPSASESELKSTIKYQMDQYIPMKIEDAKVDWVSLGQSLHDPKQQEVLLASTSNEYTESRLDFIEGLGFNIIASEPDPIAMIRSLLPTGMIDARMIIDIGDSSTDLAIVLNDAPRLVRNIPIGLNSLIRSASKNLNIQESQARQFILKFGLAPDRLNGQVFRAIENTLDSFTTELTKSVKFFQTRYPNSPVGGVLLSGFAAIVPSFGEYIAAKTSLATTLANPWQRVRVAQSDQKQLGSIASEFATVIGLAQRKNDR